MCLDVLRALKRESEGGELLSGLGRELAQWTGEKVQSIEPVGEFESEASARITVGKLAIRAAAAALAATAPPTIVDAFVRTRLLQPHAALYGADAIDPQTVEVLLERALPEG
jgi:hypothetical protein